MGSSRVDVDYYDGEMEDVEVKERRKMKEAKSMAKKRRRSGKY
jgi:hypothetical protein